MKNKLAIWLLLVISFTKTIAQNNLPPPYEIKNDSAVTIRLDDAHWQMLEDPTGKWMINSVSQPPRGNKFHTNTTKQTGIDYSVKAYWVRYRIRNALDHEVSITTQKNFSYSDLYTRNTTDQWSHKRTGTAVRWSERSDLRRINSLTYNIPAGEELIIYERNNFDYDVTIHGLPGLPAIEFSFTEKVLQEQYLENNSDILPSILFGVLILAALFNIYFFLITRERVYL